MILRLTGLLLLITATPLFSKSIPSPQIHHALSVVMIPERSFIEVQDEIKLPSPVTTVDFLLRHSLSVDSLSPGTIVRKTKTSNGPIPATHYRIRFDAPRRTFKLRYRGEVDEAVATQTRERGGGRAGSSGHISSSGVFLSGASLWYPQLPGRLVSFKMMIDLPSGWTSVSQGNPLSEDHGWIEHAPQDDIYLIAAPFHRYTLETPFAEAQAYLRSPDADLARRYLEATRDYLELYQQLLGDYPYGKFALVENFWESGYGMPSFTLLGPRVIRLPFILHTSYPHEILHNWWGNGVFVDRDSGNWSEGLTAYLADHLLQELKGKGAAYRRDSLRRYGDYVHEGEDFPLSQFKGRHGDISQAVGYGKTLMFIHMLRNRLGDVYFLEGLRLFYRDNLFAEAGYDDLKRALEEVSGLDLRDEFDQWIEGTGAPRLKLSEVSMIEVSSGYRIRATIQQTQPNPPFNLNLPIYIQTEKTPKPAPRWFTMNGRETTLDIVIREKPIRLSIDPEFDIFRHLVAGETPPTLSRLFGAPEITLILPADASSEKKAAYRSMVDSWSSRWPQLNLMWDEDVGQLPAEGNVWLLGIENRFLSNVTEQLNGHYAKLEGTSLTVSQHQLNLAGNSFALAVDGKQGRTLGLLVLDPVDAAAGLARKLPHYGKYSYTLFGDSTPTLLSRGQWASAGSVLSAPLSAEGELLPPMTRSRPPLTLAQKEAESFSPNPRQMP